MCASDRLGEKPSEPKAPPTETAKPAVKKEYYEVTINTIRGQVRHRYEKLPNGEFKYVGVIGEPVDQDETKKEPEAKGSEKSPIQ